jgi:hypothetical protein
LKDGAFRELGRCGQLQIHDEMPDQLAKDFFQNGKWKMENDIWKINLSLSTVEF